jgi:hypothetical protein
MRANRLALATLLAACGSSHPPFPNGSPDAPPGDTLPQSTGDAAPNAVTVQVTLAGTAVANVAVFFEDPQSKPVGAATTDAQGTANALVPAGGFVTVIEPDDGSGTHHLATFAGVQAGDALHLDLQAPDTAQPSTMTVQVPTYTGAAGYQLSTTCGQFGLGTGGDASVTLLGCGSTADFLVQANDTSGHWIASQYWPTVAVADGAMRALTGPYDLPVATTFSYTSVPASIEYVRTLERLVTAHGELYSDSTGSPVAGALVTNTITMPMTTGTTALVVTDNYPLATEHGEQIIYDWNAWSSTYSLDVTATLLPAFDSAPLFEPTSADLSWTERAASSSPDFARARIHLYRDAFPTGTSWTWAIVAPRTDAGKVIFPQLPATTGFDFNPHASDAIGVESVETVRAPGGYDAFRAHGFSNVTRAITGTTGTIVVQQLASPPL